jgi:two-component system, chemotaxis family, protein-glutamate methylesterase/glutaminase
MTSRPIRVLIVDDSAVVRRLVAETLRSEPDIEVVGTAADPFIARDRIEELHPDVLTLDLEMPRMDGLTFLRILMTQRPLPVIVMSSLTKSGSDHALEALRLGAFDVLGKPAGAYSFGDLGPQLIARIRAAAGARLRIASRPAVRLPAHPVAARRTRPPEVILLGASTGGTEALREVLTALPDGLPGIAIVQHIPALFSRAFAMRLDQLCAFAVREAVDGDRLEPGLALVAPGGFHLLLQWSADHYRARVVGGPPVWHQRPAVDLLFRSVADGGAARHVLAGVLTGMGRDGADGLRRLRDAGATTFAQDEATSVVYGMPRAAWDNGAAQRQLPLDRIAAYLAGHYITARGCPVPVSP